MDFVIPAWAWVALAFGAGAVVGVKIWPELRERLF
jgi:hypothetical protein